MKMSIADLFEHGHTFSEIMDMDYINEYLFIVDCINEKRGREGGKTGSREFRPVQKDAIKKAKEMNKK
jgi:hypothetical protein